LLFLGTVPADLVPQLVAAAAPVVTAAPAMTLRLAGGGWFGPPRRPQVMWVGLDGDVRSLTELARGLAGAARALDLPVEDRPFRAHLTVGRWRARQPADATLPSLLVDYRGPAWPVTEVRLLESHLGPEPRYEPVAAYPVG
jgi:2'-5' RNA ligase